jgi:hypothetical protein
MENPTVSITSVRLDLTLHQAESLRDALRDIIHHSPDGKPYYSVAVPLEKKLTTVINANVSHSSVEDIENIAVMRATDLLRKRGVTVKFPKVK